MRLLTLSPDGRKFQLKKFFDSCVPPYAILSHTWGSIEEELTFQMLQSGAPLRTRSRRLPSLGWEKLLFCSQQAKKDGLDYFWIDTCCINKESSAELSEAINSMFEWYRKAAVCYVYLSDVSSVDKSYEEFLQDFKASRWLTRSWTLQELIAPIEVQFCSREGTYLMNKREKAEVLAEITGIPSDALLGIPVCLFTTDERLSWLGARQTIRREDRAYCLQGLLDVYMPPIYGEKDRAMDRLEEEVKKVTQRADYFEESRKLNTMMRTYPAAYPVYWAASENLWPAIYQLTEGDVQPSISSEAKLNFDTKFKAFWQVLEAGTHLDDRWFTLGYLTGLFPFEKRIEQYILPRIYHLYEYLLKKGADPNKCTSIWNLPLD